MYFILNINNFIVRNKEHTPFVFKQNAVKSNVVGGIFHLFHKNNVSVISAELFTLEDRPVFVLYLNIIK